MLKTRLIDAKTGRDLRTYSEDGDAPLLVITTHAKDVGRFASTILATAGTQTIVEAKGDEGIVLTDLIISGEKVNGGTITVQFTDAVNTVSIVLATVTDGPVNLAHPFAGHWAGWQGCDIKVVTVGNIDGCVSLGYYRTSKEITPMYAEWNSLR